MDQPTQAQTGSRGDQEGRVYPDPMPLTHDIMQVSGSQGQNKIRGIDPNTRKFIITCFRNHISKKDIKNIFFSDFTKDEKQTYEQIRRNLQEKQLAKYKRRAQKWMGQVIVEDFGIELFAGAYCLESTECALKKMKKNNIGNCQIFKLFGARNEEKRGEHLTKRNYLNRKAMLRIINDYKYELVKGKVNKQDYLLFLDQFYYKLKDESFFNKFQSSC